MKTIYSILSGLLMCVLTGFLLAQVFDVASLIPILACIGVSIMLGYINSKQPNHVILRAGLLQEIWIPDMADRFFDDDSFLMDGKDWTPWVENDAINLQEIGVAPNVVKNRQNYPVPASQRSDVPIRLSLDDYSTDSTIIRDVETVSLSYDKRMSVVNDHKRVLQQKIADDGIYNVSPTAQTNDTPIFKTSGDISALTGNRILKSDDVMKMAIAFDNRKFTKKGRTILVPPTAFWEFVNTDPTLKRQAELNGKGGTETDVWVAFMGFKIMSRVTTAYYNKGTLSKLGYGVAPAVSDKQAAIVYIANESFGKGLGSTEMYAKVKDPDQQGDVINFRQRAIVLPVRQKSLGAIVCSD